MKKCPKPAEPAYYVPCLSVNLNLCQTPEGWNYLGFAEKVCNASDTRRRSEGVYEYYELKPTK
jgi:hypothetical protein